MEHLSDDLEDHPNQHKNSHKLCNELVEFILKLMIRNFQWGESQCRTNTSINRKKEIQKSRTMRITVRDLSRKVNHLSKVF